MALPKDSLTGHEYHQWLGFLKRQRLEISNWVYAVTRTNLLIGSKSAWLKAYALARGRYQRELLMGFKRWDGAGGTAWLERGGKKLDLRHLRKESIAALRKRLKLEGVTWDENNGRQCALQCTRPNPFVPEEASKAITVLSHDPTARGLGEALGLLWKAREEAGISRSIRFVPEPGWLLDGEQVRHERRNAQKRAWKIRRRKLVP
jgi:hypothetical protein